VPRLIVAQLLKPAPALPVLTASKGGGITHELLDDIFRLPVLVAVAGCRRISGLTDIICAQCPLSPTPGPTAAAR
jgi:hypothetical protein